VRTISFDMQKSTGGNAIGGGGAGWAFYAPRIIPEPSCAVLLGFGILLFAAATRRS
jgi:hypothetical protein